MSYAESYDPDGGIAIVGISGRFPGARDPAEFWRVLVEGRETLTRFAAEDLEPSVLEEPGSRDDPAYVRVRGVLQDADRFDPAFFGLNPREAEVMDPQQRAMLEVSWEALEDAGIVPGEFPGAIGVYAGAGYNMYLIENLLSRRDVVSGPGLLTTLVGNEHDYLATRVAYKLDLKGPALTIQTACSTSLVAVCSAVQSLQSYQCDVALAGGVAILLPQKRGYLWQDGSITSPDGHCRPFDAQAAGTVFGNGAGVVVLKRLADAVAAGDRIYAVIKGAALNNDGSSKVSFTAPSVDGHSQVIMMAQALAGVDPSTISYIEAHATATSLGDPVEVAGLTQAFRMGGAEGTGYCAIGSVKGNVGHLDAAAGVTGLIKTALSLWHGQLPASINYSSPNPKLGLETSPFFVNSQLRPWPRGEAPRRAGVSSFGVGGTNAHVVVEEAPLPASGPTRRSASLLVVSARTADSADSALRRLADRLEQEPGMALPDVAFTLHTGRKAFGVRRAMVARSVADAVAGLRGEGQRLLASSAAPQTRSVAFLFPGQGSQYVNMGKALYESEPVFRAEVDACADVLRPLLGFDLRAVLYPEPGQEAAASERLRQTAVTQPALFVIEYALARLWMHLGVDPVAMIGHSVGEYVAACLGGLFTRDDALRLLFERSRLMQQQPAGQMLSVRLGALELAPHLEGTGVCIAAHNAPQLTVVSGETAACQMLAQRLAAAGVTAKPLATSHAFHSSMMEPVVVAFERIVAATPMREPERTWISSLTGRTIVVAEVMSANYWARQLREPVQFCAGIGQLLDASMALLEVGPGQALCTLRRQHREHAREQLVLPSMHGSQDATLDGDAFLAAAGRLWCEGVNLDWQRLYEGETRCRVSLPTYAFERRRCWVDPGASMPPLEVSAQQGTQPEYQEVDVDNQKALMVTKVQQLFSDLSGIEAAALTATVPYLELGLDSLFLAQATGAIQKHFGVRVSVRELGEGLGTVDALAERLLQLAPQSLPAAPAAKRPAAAGSAVAGASLAPRGSATASAEGLAAVFAQQLELMARQLDMLQGAGVTPAAPVASQTLPAPPKAPVVRPAAAAAADSRPIAFGPYRPPTRGPSGGLNDRQQKALAELISQYTTRTPGSKSFTAANRAHLADPRSVAGFRQIWKEMVYPIVTVRSSGSKLWDVDGNEYIDLVNGFGMALFGHNPDFIASAIRQQLEAGFEIGPQTPLAGEVAALVSEFSGCARVAFCSTGSEAVMAAIRIARTVSARDRIVMFTGDYHGIFDEVLARPVQSGDTSRSLPIAPGIPAAMVENITVLEYGAPATLQTLREMAGDVAAIIVEPVQSRRPDLQPREFLKELREIATKGGAALVFDEVVTGFRSCPGGAQEIFGVRADIVTYGKVVGGGMPIGIVAGSAHYLDALDGGGWQYGDDSYPEVGVTFFAGTFVRHPLSLASARAVLQKLKAEGPQLQRKLNRRTTQLVQEINSFAAGRAIPLKVTHFSSMFYFNFPSDLPLASLFFPLLRARGIHIWEGRPGFLGVAHSEDDIAAVTHCICETLVKMVDCEFLPGNTSQSAGA
jgi:acyl transferase domain-containing protein/glutamate-1-semialdehyde aminotransferase